MEYVTPKEYASLTGKSLATVYNQIKKNPSMATKIDGKLMVVVLDDSKQELEDALEDVESIQELKQEIALLTEKMDFLKLENDRMAREQVALLDDLERERENVQKLTDTLYVLSQSAITPKTQEAIDIAPQQEGFFARVRKSLFGK